MRICKGHLKKEKHYRIKVLFHKHKRVKTTLVF